MSLRCWGSNSLCPLPPSAVPFLAGEGYQELPKGGAALAALFPVCTLPLRSFVVLPDGFFQEASWYTGSGRERESHSALRRTGVDAPTSPPTSPCTFPSPSQVRFLQFVKLVIIFLGAFFLFFKCKVYLYSIFKVVKKKSHETKPNESSGSLLASGVTINLSMLAGCASSLLRVPLTQGG